jgi:regulator of protease activity HflC (stomatin/prohibitin superfamily)
MSEPASPAPTLRPATTPNRDDSAPAVSIAERQAWSISGWYGVAGIVLAALLIWYAADQLSSAAPGAGASPAIVTLLVLAIIAIGLLAGTMSVIQPLETRVVLFFGRYVGTVRHTGLIMTAPLTTRRRVSVRVDNFECRKLKVNDSEGNPVELAGIVVWRVRDTARSVFAVTNCVGFVQVQAEAALRHVAMSHPYDTESGDRPSLRGSTDQVSLELAREVAARVEVAGVEVIEVRISHLAYAPEIAQAMLQRQQAAAIIAARSRIVDGAVGMVEMALARLQERDVVQLDEERKAAMVSNLLVVLCGDSRATPVVNTGTLYQ